MDRSQSIAELLKRVEAEARNGDLSLDTPIYEKSKRDPYTPIMFTGSLNAPLAVMARDLGWQEVKYAEPLIGDAGQRVRRALYRAVTGQEPPKGDPHLSPAMEHVLFTNTVPYKPVGNKAYPTAVKERFRPFLEELLVCHWAGDYLITMGTEAYQWFARYAEKGESEAFWKQPDRFEAEFRCTVTARCDGREVRKDITIAPLPHPSPLNRTYLALFPEMLEKRLEQAPIPRG
jgi:uracil-DNA glycosylase